MTALKLSEELMQRLRCMHSGKLLRVADQPLLERVNAAIRKRQLHDGLGRAIEDTFEGGLVDETNSHFYPIVEDILQMMKDESIDLRQLNFKADNHG